MIDLNFRSLEGYVSALILCVLKPNECSLNLFIVLSLKVHVMPR
jgi:hypothetical protein